MVWATTYEKKDYMVVCEVGKTGSSREPPNVRIPILRLRYTRTVSLVLYLSTLTDNPLVSLMHLTLLE